MRKKIRRWTMEEVAAITDPARPHDWELARELKRSQTSITVKRCEMNKKHLSLPKMARMKK